MGFKNRNFDTPVYTEQEEEPERVIIISCEGRNTEPEYFETVKTKLSDHISSLVEITIVPKEDNKSNPQDIVENLEDFITTKYDYKSDFDEMWIVCDRESVEARKKHIIEIIPHCESKGYQLSISNPLFEFWLLLHIVDISGYDKDKLLKNEYVSEAKNRRFIDKELSDKLENGFNKKKGRFNTEIVSVDNIKRALDQEKLFENDRDKILDHLGSNVGDLMKRILPSI